MRVTAVAVTAMAVVVEEEETDNVGSKAETSYNQHKLRVADFLRLDETLNGFKEDGETQSDKEDSVDQGSQGFSALPLEECEFVSDLCTEI